MRLAIEQVAEGTDTYPSIPGLGHTILYHTIPYHTIRSLRHVVVPWLGMRWRCLLNIGRKTHTVGQPQALQHSMCHALRRVDDPSSPSRSVPRCSS